MEQFTIHVTIGPRSKATFQLTYEEVLRRKLTQYDIVIKVKPKQLVQHFEVDHRRPHAGQGLWSWALAAPLLWPGAHLVPMLSQA